MAMDGLEEDQNPQVPGPSLSQTRGAPAQGLAIRTPAHPYAHLPKNPDGTAHFEYVLKLPPSVSLLTTYFTNKQSLTFFSV